MSKILLTSTGLSNEKVRKKFIEIIGESRGVVAIITTASEEKENNKYCQLALKQLKEIGFNTIDFVDLETEPDKDFSKYDVIYVSGGTTFRLLKFAGQTNFKKTVQALLDRGGIYIGVSAGSYIMCPTIEMSTWKRDDVNSYGLTDLTALNFVPFLLSVHYEPKHKELIKQGVAQTKYPVKILTDEQALLIIDNQVEFVGDDEEIKL